MNVTEKVSIVYGNNKVLVTGQSLKGTLEISADELKRISWGMLGSGYLNVNIDSDQAEADNETE